MAAGQYIDYEALAQEAMQDAMRGVVRSVLLKVGASGLGGDHHFYIAFNTQAPGVVISRRLKEKYPLEMTIVLQHRFWDLEVNDERFSVKLTFDGIPERLVVPFKAVKVFYDPSVPYGLQFEDSELSAGGARHSVMTGQDGAAMTPSAGLDTEKLTPPRPAALDRAERKPARRPKADKPEKLREAGSAANGPGAPVAGEQQPSARPAKGEPQPLRPHPVLTEVKGGDQAASPAAPAREDGGADSKVVNIAQFRPKKT